jgi:hypothetical protein
MAGLGHQKIRLVWQGDVPTENVSALRSPSLSDLMDHSAPVERGGPSVQAWGVTPAR